MSNDHFRLVTAVYHFLVSSSSHVRNGILEFDQTIKLFSPNASKAFFRDHWTAHRPDHRMDSALIPWLFDNHALEYHFRDQAPYRDQKTVSGVEGCVACCEVVVIVGDFFENSQKYLAGVIFQEQLWFLQIVPFCLLRFVFVHEGGISFDLTDNHIQLITFRK